MEINNNTLLKITEIKRGAGWGKNYEITAGEFIRIVKNKDCDGDLNVGVEPIYDTDGEIEEWTEDRFYDLPIAEQLNMCLRDEGDRFASDLKCVVVA